MKEVDPAILEKRAKRLERREKQRAANVGRAAKMHAFRLAAGGQPTPSKKRQPPKINIGCSGWFYWHWRGHFYDESMATNRWFAHYAQHFQTVELNAPFYSWPTVAAV